MDFCKDDDGFLYSLLFQPISNIELNTSGLEDKIDKACGFNYDIMILKFISDFSKYEEVSKWLYSNDARLLSSAKVKVNSMVLELEKQNIVTNESMDVLRLFCKYDTRFTFRLIMDVVNKLSCFLSENIKYQNIVNFNSIVKKMFEEQCDVDFVVKATGLSFEEVNDIYEQYKSELIDKKGQDIIKDNGFVRSIVYDSMVRSKKIV